MVVPYLEQKNRDKHVSSRERQLEKHVSGAAARKGKSHGKGKRNSDYCVQGQHKEVSVERKKTPRTSVILKGFSVHLSMKELFG